MPRKISSSKRGRRTRTPLPSTQPSSDELPIGDNEKKPSKPAPPRKTHRPPPLPPKSKISNVALPNNALVVITEEEFPCPNSSPASTTTASTPPASPHKPPPLPPIDFSSKEVPGKQSQKNITAFANDPVRSHTLSVDRADIEKLQGQNFLATSLVDFIIQRAIPKTLLPDNIIIGSSNSLSFFEMMNRKEEVKVDSRDQQVASTTACALRRKYHPFSKGRYQFIAVNCAKNHFVVISLVFDTNLPRVFDNVCVYDSLRKSSRTRQQVATESIPSHFLRQFQVFLCNYCFYNTKWKKLLTEMPDLILENAIFRNCPQQENSYDCALFGFGVLLHLVYGHTLVENLFTQRNIDKLRKGLYQSLRSGSKSEEVGPNFFCSFFPSLENGLPVKKWINNSWVNVRVQQSAGENGPMSIPKNKESLGEKSGVKKGISKRKIVGELESSTSDLAETFDKMFAEMFLEKYKEYETLTEIDDDIDTFEGASGCRLIIQRSDEHSRRYVCRSHIGCCFRAKFGRKRGSDVIILKKTMTKAYHSGEKAPPTAKGRAYKRRLKGRLESVVDSVAVHKDGKPVAKDVMKAAAFVEAMSITYNQSYRAVHNTSLRKWTEDEASFQLIVPYLNKFLESNVDSTARCEFDGNHVSRVFVCPGIMKETLLHARPVMSLDAAHLKSKWKGILYTASVKTGNNDIYPVAFAIINDNENESGWHWFLELLKSTLPCLIVDHPRKNVRFKLFTFISDRQKGLIEALNNVFPENHSCYCAIHLARNAEKICGKKVAKSIYNLSTTFSKLVSSDLLEKIGKSSIKGRNYVEEITPQQWRSTEWLEDTGLPPRFGIVTSNLSESTNNMFQEARECSWLLCIDFILGKMQERISTLRQRYHGKDGVLEHVVGIIKKHWDVCAGYKVLEGGKDGGDQFTIIRQRHPDLDSNARHNIAITNNRCTCGEWQEHSIPCVDALAYFRLHDKLTMGEVLAKHVSTHYMYPNLRQMLEVNIVPVCMDTISPDGITCPPKESSKRSSGRPKKKRIRNRSRWAKEPERSNIVCSKCKKRGHNVRTCDARALLKKEQEAKKKKGVAKEGIKDTTLDNNINALDLS